MYEAASQKYFHWDPSLKSQQPIENVPQMHNKIHTHAHELTKISIGIGTLCCASVWIAESECKYTTQRC